MAHTEPGFHLQHCINWVSWHIPVILALGIEDKSIRSSRSDLAFEDSVRYLKPHPKLQREGRKEKREAGSAATPHSEGWVRGVTDGEEVIQAWSQASCAPSAFIKRDSSCSTSYICLSILWDITDHREAEGRGAADQPGVPALAKTLLNHLSHGQPFIQSV